VPHNAGANSAVACVVGRPFIHERQQHMPKRPFGKLPAGSKLPPLSPVLLADWSPNLFAILNRKENNPSDVPVLKAA
jgi:hypothetical protein